MADSSVTPDKISNSASESPRIISWVDDSTDFTFDATGGSASNHVIASDIELTVPEGKAYNYVVHYAGVLFYSWVERKDSNTAIYGAWNASLLAMLA